MRTRAFLGDEAWLKVMISQALLNWIDAFSAA